MCKNALTKINKTNPNLSLFESGAPGNAGQSSGISSIKNVTLKLRPGYYKPLHLLFIFKPKSQIFLLSLQRKALITTHT